MQLILSIFLSVFRMVAIPVEFSDTGFTVNSEELSVTVSKVQSYFNHQFDDRTFQFDLVPAVRLPHPISYYGDNYTDRKDALLHEAVREACSAVSASRDLSVYDNNSDGTVDNVLLIMAGLSEADGGGAQYFWPQYNCLRDNGGMLQCGNVHVDGYSVCTEMTSNDGINFHPAGPGVMCHEIAHSFGLIDLYDTDGEGSGGMSPGLMNTSLMDMGCKNDNGNTPPNLNAIDLEMMKAGHCDTLRKGNYTLKPIDTGRRYLKALTDTEGEYFLFECRKASGWDAPLGKSGLVVYHIDRSSSPAGYSDYYQTELSAADRWNNRQVNNRPDRMCAEIVCAFYPQADHTGFGSDTEPAFRYWNGKASSLAISGIHLESDGSVSFKVIEPLILDNVTAFQDAAIISWKKDVSLAGGDYTIEWTDGKNSYSAAIPGGKTGYTIEGLNPATAYRFTLKLNAGGGEIYSVTASFTTKVYRPDTYPYIYLKGTVRNVNGSFPVGARLPLRLFNCTNVREIKWYFNGTPITTGNDGFFTLKRSGLLMAVVTHVDGTSETIIKEIRVK